MQSHVAPLLKPIVMNLEQLIFTWKERQLVLALLTSSFLNEIANLYQGFHPLAMFLKNSAYWNGNLYYYKDLSNLQGFLHTSNFMWRSEIIPSLE